MNIDKYISELLFEHNCVIIPGFGGFVANYGSALIHPVQHTFTPPFKKILFNKSLRNNDGLLVNHIAVREKKTYKEALKIVEDFAVKVEKELKIGRRVEISEVGALFADVENNWQFQPAREINYLTDAFGLAEFQSPAIKRDNLHQRIEKQFKDKPPVPREVKKIRLKKYWPVLAALPAAFLAVWLPLKTDLASEISYTYSSFSLFVSEPALYIERKDAPGKTEKEFSDNEFAFIEALPVTEEKEAAVISAIEPAKPAPMAKKENSSGTYYYIIGGCFQNMENAARLVSKINGKGYNALLLTPSKGLHPVAYNKYTSEEEARAALQKIREKYQPDAWMMVK